VTLKADSGVRRELSGAAVLAFVAAYRVPLLWRERRTRA
jgi:hypothetical protein